MTQLEDIIKQFRALQQSGKAWPDELNPKDTSAGQMVESYNHLLRATKTLFKALTYVVMSDHGYVMEDPAEGPVMDDPEKAKDQLIDQYARLAYEGYGRQARWLTHDAKPMPTSYDDMREDTRENWRAAIWNCLSNNVKAMSVASAQQPSVRFIMSVKEINSDPVASTVWPFPVPEPADQPIPTPEQPTDTDTTN